MVPGLPAWIMGLIRLLRNLSKVEHVQVTTSVTGPTLATVSGPSRAAVTQVLTLVPAVEEYGTWQKLNSSSRLPW